jgi:hypothetical protein
MLLTEIGCGMNSPKVQAETQRLGPQTIHQGNLKENSLVALRYASAYIETNMRRVPHLDQDVVKEFMNNNEANAITNG